MARIILTISWDDYKARVLLGALYNVLNLGGDPFLSPDERAEVEWLRDSLRDALWHGLWGPDVVETATGTKHREE